MTPASPDMHVKKIKKNGTFTQNINKNFSVNTAENDNKQQILKDVRYIIVIIIIFIIIFISCI